MDPTFTLYADWMKYIRGLCNAYVGENVAAVALFMKPFAFRLLAVYVVLWGLASLLGAIQDPLNDMIKRVLTITAVFTVAFNLAVYNTLVTNFFVNGPDEFAAAMARAPKTGDVISGLDIALNQGYSAGKKFWDKGGFVGGDFGHYLLAVIVWVITIVDTGYGFFLMVLAAVALALLIPLGPAIVITLMFQTTANYFNGWIRQMSNYFMVPILVVAVNLLVLKMFAKAAQAANALDLVAVDTIFPFLAMGIVSFLALASVLTMAAGLGGGVALSSFGLGRFVANMLKSKGTQFLTGAAGAAKGAGKGWSAANTGLYNASGYVARAAWGAYGSFQAQRNRNSISKTK